MERSLYRLVSWIDAAAVRAGVDPQLEAHRVVYTLVSRNPNRVEWWRLHTGKDIRRAPSKRRLAALINVYRERAHERSAWQ